MYIYIEVQNETHTNKHALDLDSFFTTNGDEFQSQGLLMWIDYRRLVSPTTILFFLWTLSSNKTWCVIWIRKIFGAITSLCRQCAFFVQLFYQFNICRREKNMSDVIWENNLGQVRSWKWERKKRGEADNLTPWKLHQRKKLSWIYPSHKVYGGFVPKFWYHDGGGNVCWATAAVNCEDDKLMDCKVLHKKKNFFVVV